MADQTYDKIVAQIRASLQPGDRVVFVSGYFNIVHPGHLRLFQYAVQCGEKLVVGVLEKHHLATVPADMRLEGVRAISLVGQALLLTGPVEEFIKKLQPEVIIKGKEHSEAFNIEQELVEAYGGKLLFGSGEVRFSSLDLIQREYGERNFSSIRKPTDFPARHGFTVSGLKTVLEGFSKLRVTVIGDLIVDEYITCDPLGMSQEDPTIVVTPIERKRFIGGAGIVAAHAKGLGADVSYFTVAGDDATAQYAQEVLSGYGVDTTMLFDDSRPTTLKQRYRAGGKTLLRVSELRQHPITPDIANELFRRLSERLAQTDLLIFSDFNYGCLPQPLVDSLVSLAARKGVSMVADSQASSQMSDVSRFKGMELITPTEREARLALQDGESGLAVIIHALQRKAQAKSLVITLGAEGMVINNPNGVTDRLPAFNTAPKDPAGAGDSFLTCASMALRTGADIWQSSYLGALAAACQVSRVGNTPLTQDDLIQEIDWDAP